MEKARHNEGLEWCPEADLNHRHADFQSSAICGCSIASKKKTVKPTSGNQHFSEGLSNRSNAGFGDFRDDPIAIRLALVREARELFGRKIAQRVWGQLGLPHPSPPNRLRQTETALAEHIRKFATECIVFEPGAATSAASMFATHRLWSKGTPFAAITQTSFGRALNVLGLQRRKSHSTIYLDCSVKPEQDRAELPL